MRFCIRTYQPREGPETDCMCNTDVSRSYIPLSTSGVAGNIDGKYSKSAFPSYRYLSTSRGAGNIRSMVILSIDIIV